MPPPTALVQCWWAGLAALILLILNRYFISFDFKLKHPERFERDCKEQTSFQPFKETHLHFTSSVRGQFGTPLLRLDPQFFQVTAEGLAMVPLNLDDPLFARSEEGAPGPALLFQLSRQVLQKNFILRESIDHGDRLPTASVFFDPKEGHKFVTFRVDLGLTGAL